jgi:hypothetical protein
LRRADHPSKESYQLSNRFTSKNPSTPQGKRGRLRKKERKKERKFDNKVTFYLFPCFSLLKYVNMLLAYLSLTDWLHVMNLKSACLCNLGKNLCIAKVLLHEQEKRAVK